MGPVSPIGPNIPIKRNLQKVHNVLKILNIQHILGVRKAFRQGDQNGRAFRLTGVGYGASVTA